MVQTSLSLGCLEFSEFTHHNNSSPKTTVAGSVEWVVSLAPDGRERPPRLGQATQKRLRSLRAHQEAHVLASRLGSTRAKGLWGGSTCRIQDASLMSCLGFQHVVVSSCSIFFFFTSTRCRSTVPTVPAVPTRFLPCFSSPSLDGLGRAGSAGWSTGGWKHDLTVQLAPG